MNSVYELKYFISIIKSLHIEDTRIAEYTDEIINIFSEDEDKTIKSLPLFSEEEISWIAPNFDQIAGTLQSKSFINCIESIGEKYPNIPYKQDDIQDAKDAMDE
ncbi:hypothetical protein ETU09_07480 [Apibacter muscae]|uniref:Uncharacterized protein n=1 Tax=Apibacter muscae TaxID=2509004 RepID=A0A563DC33_9FLAO|nr:hypothetical protein [Apibacter muscae]TWP27481.1 hypothetical protein ETU09_07480 [Apibacter muscae]